MKVAIGVDPGLKGGLAILHENGVAWAVPFDEAEYIKAITTVKDFQCIACVEKVGAMPGQGVTSMFSFGKNAGFIEGVLQSFGIPYQLVPPQTWKKEFSVTKDKNTSITVCKRLFPDVSLLPTERCRKESDGLAEALLLAEYCRRKM